MSTRGVLGFIIDGEEKIQYVHADSYPDVLGLRVLRWARSTPSGPVGWGLVCDQARDLTVVTIDETPAPALQESLAGYAQYQQPSDDWYVLLHRTQGDPAAILRAGYILDAEEFPNSGSCEWGYILDLDEGLLEVYGRGHTPVCTFALWNLPLDDSFVEVVTTTAALA